MDHARQLEFVREAGFLRDRRHGFYVVAEIEEEMRERHTACGSSSARARMYDAWRRDSRMWARRRPPRMGRCSHAGVGQLFEQLACINAGAQWEAEKPFRAVRALFEP